MGKREDKYNKVQINLWINKEWKEQLNSLARQEAAKKDQDTNIHDLIKEAIKEKYSLKEI